MEKLKAFFDSKGSWLGLGALVGAIWGDQASAAVNAIGVLVMSVL